MDAHTKNMKEASGEGVDAAIKTRSVSILPRAAKDN